MATQFETAATVMGALLDRLQSKINELEAGQERIENLLANLVVMIAEIHQRSNPQGPIKEWYTPTEVAQLLGKRPYTVREWCRLQRIDARKRLTGRGEADEWEISAGELERYKNHGLLPIPTKY